MVSSARSFSKSFRMVSFGDFTSFIFRERALNLSSMAAALTALCPRDMDYWLCLSILDSNRNDTGMTQ